jgi:hypothetical protein
MTSVVSGRQSDGVVSTRPQSIGPIRGLLSIAWIRGLSHCAHENRHDYQCQRNEQFPSDAEAPPPPRIVDRGVGCDRGIGDGCGRLSASGGEGFGVARTHCSAARIAFVVLDRLHHRAIPP